MKENIIKELKKRGYNPEIHKVLKNGVYLEGVVLNKEVLNKEFTISPIIYLKEFCEDCSKNIEDIVDEIVDIHHSCKPSFDLTNLVNRDFVLEHLYVAMQHKSHENLIRLDVDINNTEAYLIIRYDSETACSIKVTPEILLECHIDIEEAKEVAYNNTRKESVLVELPNPDKKIYAITNKVQWKGASAILNNELLKKYASMVQATKVACVPTSIHEWMLFPYNESMNIDMMEDALIKSNFMCINPYELLDEKIYIFELNN